jgi:hypothetical protein
MTAHHGYPNSAGQVVIAGNTNPANNGSFTIQPIQPMQPYFGQPYGGIGASPGANWSFNSVTTEAPATSLEVFEDLVGLIRQLEAQLGLNTKDVNKDRWLDTIMGRIQEEAINATIQRLKALKL